MEELQMQEINMRLDVLTEKLKRIKEKTPKFDVKDKRNDKLYKVWSIRNDSTGFPHFLIYDTGAWKWQSAKYFTPIEEA